MRRAHRRTMMVIEQSGDNVLCRVDKTSACRTQCGGCSDSEVIVAWPSKLLNGAPQSVGDAVQFEASGEILLALSLLVYLSPVMLMLLFSVGCSILLPGSDAMVALAACGGLSVGLGAVFLFGRNVVQQKLGSHLALHRKA